MVVNKLSSFCHQLLPPFSSSLSLSTVIAAPDPSLQGVMGITDWDFLRPSNVPVEDDDHAHRPSLDDFDGEIAVFQARVIY